MKGAYLEPASIAYPEKGDVDRAYVKLVQRGLLEGAYVAVATHDERIIRHVQQFAAREDIPRDRFEFQMLYGVRPALQRSIAAEGYKVLVAAPYGPDWYPYFMRRLAERPANVGVLPPEPGAPMSPLPTSSDVVVVGGGVIGTSTAFHLAEAASTSASSRRASSPADRRAAPPAAFVLSSRIR